jgi:hypothetical protein
MPMPLMFMPMPLTTFLYELRLCSFVSLSSLSCWGVGVVGCVGGRVVGGRVLGCM